MKTQWLSPCAVCRKLDDDELGSDTAPWSQEVFSGYSYLTWLHTTCCHRVVATLMCNLQ